LSSASPASNTTAPQRSSRHNSSSGPDGSGPSLFDALDRLDRQYAEKFGQPFLRSLDILFERSQALEDLEAEATDNAHFIYRVCILSAIVDRFNFSSERGSLNGLREWLANFIGAQGAMDLTAAFQRVKDLRKQYPIHEHFAVDSAGERQRRREVVAAEEYFGVRSDQDDPIGDWNAVLTRFTETVRLLSSVIEDIRGDRCSE
jgi:hypothetical protein